VSAALDRRVDAALAALRHGGALELAAEGKAIVRQNGRALLRVAADAAQALVTTGLVGKDGRIAAEGEARLRRAAAGEAGFVAQHLELGRVRDPEGGARLVVDLAESPLGWLARRKGKDGVPLVDAAQLAAGERLRADADRARLPPRVTTSWDAVAAPATRGDGMAAFSDGTLAARDRVNRALAAVGPELGGVLLDVCCFLKGLEALERERGWPARTGRIVLGLALDRLAAHYGLAREARGPARGRLAGWMAPGARPTVGGEPA
jgi:hypothetical protein